jgi:NAD(P)-dependent dehydrogenase (short-subunit alcohol dehydrogenase family)
VSSLTSKITQTSSIIDSHLGGASGIGLGITRHFLTQPDTHITILDVNKTSGTQVLHQLQTEFPRASVSFEECDVSSWESQATAFEKVYARQGRVDIAFANAGISREGNILPAKGDGGPVKPNLKTLDVNLVGVIYSKTVPPGELLRGPCSE